ncbi:hypothetical protein FBALC1_03652 [Flavobacteriales bacterium ALC-1]|nr:hypothetical protein FBALC1_03652 [Flavobacteriales bacterium ALC-1]
MINFFRRVRQRLFTENKFSKYLIYAIGEIILVVIGILLALQINNWNEHRKTRLTESTELNKLLGDLKLDSIAFDSNIKVLSEINNLHQQLYNIGYKNSNEPLTESPRHIRRYVAFEAPSQKTSTLLVSQLNNETIRKELIDYNEDLNKGLIEMNEFISIVKDKIRPYLGQKEVYNLSSQFEALDANDVNMLSKNDLIKISKNSDFQQLLFEANFKLKSIINGLKNKLLTQNNSLRNLIINELKAY